MTESTARAEVLTSPSSSSSYYIWEVPQKPVLVRLAFNLIDRMEKEVVDSFRSLTSRGSEIGGLLLGTLKPGAPMVVCVEDYQAIPCDYARGPLYRLSDADMGRFERAMEQQAGAPDLRVVGFFRSHTRKGLSLDAEDAAFFEARFREPHQVALLVRPYATKASTAGLFIWEQGSLHPECSYMEFPFRSAQLTAGPPAPASDPLPAPAVSAAAPAPAAPKPLARAQIVPIASRREITLPAAPATAEIRPLEAPVPAAPAAPAVPEPATQTPAQALAAASAAAASAAQAVAAPTPAPVLKPVSKPVAAPIPPPISPDAEAPAAEEPETPAAADAPKINLKSEEKAARGFKPLAIGIVIAAALLVAVFLFVYPGMLRHPHVALPGQDSSPLALRIERTGTDILLTWNRDSDAIRNATHAVLSISDGDRRENYDMDLGQLRNGSIVYSPLTADVSFRMEVTDKGQAKTTSESVRVLRTRPSPIPEENQPAAGDPTKPAPTTPAVAAPTAKPAENTPPASDSAQTSGDSSNVSGPPTKPFDASLLSSRLRPATSNDVPVELPDAPAMGQVAVQTPSSIPGVNLGSVAPAPMAPPAPAPAAAAPKAPPKVVTGGQIRQAELVYRKEPEYPKLARQMGVKGVVEVVATIGTDGKVKNVKVLHGHPLLEKAATEAVMQWLYRPTLLNGVPVQNETRITLNFTGGQ